ncbi:MAG: chemotaxis response regulator protein-glutamate methylesterase, partial [Pseudomonadota bacterium]
MADARVSPEHTAPIKVMVVDDSATMRTWLSFVIDKDPRLTVVAHAANAIEARDLIKETNPDILTLDLE